MPAPRRLLILGGTAEAAALAAAVAAAFGGRVEVTSSLAGRTEGAARRLPGRVRVGGFGGAPGLEAYLAAEGIEWVIDATHPFAAAISRNARAACDAAGVPRLMLLRREWPRGEGDKWIEVDSAAEAAARLPGLGRRAFLGVGAGQIAAFADVAGVWFLVRLVDRPPAPLPLRDFHVVYGRGPFTLAAEIDMLRRHEVAVVVTKASGGAATEAKIAAARALGLPVLMIRRPPREPGEAVEDVEAAVAWLAARLGDGE